MVEFPANKTFRKNMRKYLFVFCKLFRKISYFLAKIIGAQNAKTKWNFTKNENFAFCENCSGIWVNCILKMLYFMMYVDMNFMYLFFDHFYKNYQIKYSGFSDSCKYSAFSTLFSLTGVLCWTNPRAFRKTRSCAFSCTEKCLKDLNPPLTKKKPMPFLIICHYNIRKSNLIVMIW